MGMKKDMKRRSENGGIDIKSIVGDQSRASLHGKKATIFIPTHNKNDQQLLKIQGMTNKETGDNIRS